MRREWTAADRVLARITYAKRKSAAAYATWTVSKSKDDQERWLHYDDMLTKAYKDRDTL